MNIHYNYLLSISSFLKSCLLSLLKLLIFYEKFGIIDKVISVEIKNNNYYKQFIKVISDCQRLPKRFDMLL